MDELSTVGARYTFGIRGQEFGEDTLTGTLVKQEYVDEYGNPMEMSTLRKFIFSDPVSNNDNYKLTDRPFEYRNFDMIFGAGGQIKARPAPFHVSNSRGIDYLVHTNIELQ
jgi:hypothetical protein